MCPLILSIGFDDYCLLIIIKLSNLFQYGYIACLYDNNKLELFIFQYVTHVSGVLRNNRMQHKLRIESVHLLWACQSKKTIAKNIFHMTGFYQR